MRVLLCEAAEEHGDRRGASLRYRLLGGALEAAIGGSPEELAARLGDGTSAAMLAHSSDGAIGFALYDPRHALLQLLYVAVDHRRQGIGSVLVSAVEAALAEASAPSLTVVASAGDRAEKSLFEALGYRAELLAMTKRDRPTRER